ncbi:MAG: DUF2298 domain-containing protein [Blastochloris sp.]|nr:DUF2298 domain-containing protein [Blastochloris sp.]
MNHLFNLICITMLLINLAGLTAGAVRLTGLTFGLAKAFTLLSGCLIFFFIEHFYGFKSLSLLLYPSTAFSVWLLWKMRFQLKNFIGAELAFLAGFGFTLMWRYFYPNIDANTERLADLSFVASYLQGGTLPPPDLWLHPYKLTQYYSFQHYAAGLLGRVMDISAGMACHLAYCVIVGLVMAPAYDYIQSRTPSRWIQILVLAALMLGGSGAVVFTPFLVKNETLFSAMRFIGITTVDTPENLTELGVKLAEFSHGVGYRDRLESEAIPELAMEVFSYSIQLGDYHAYLSSYVLLAMALAAFGLLLNNPNQKWALGCLMATIPLTLVSHTWILPLQVILVGFFLLFLWRYRGQPDWKTVFGSSLLVTFLLYPFLTYFLNRGVYDGMSFEFVQAGQHAPVLAYFMVFWPIYFIIIALLFVARKEYSPFRWFVVLIVLFLILVETVNLNDLYSGRFERFNTTLKWWSWLAALVTLMLAPICLSLARRISVSMILTLAALLGTLYFAVGLGRAWILGDKGDRGHLNGAAYLTQTEPANVHNSIMSYLKVHPQGVTLEKPVKDRQAFVETGAISVFTGHPSVFGWVSHEKLWRGYQKDIEQRWNRSTEFFLGELTSPIDFLNSYEVQYILWPMAEPVDKALFDKIADQIKTHFIFVRFDEANPLIGIWVRKNSLP